MRRHRPVMNAMRGQIRMLEGNPGLPGGVLARPNPIPATQHIREAVWHGAPAHELTHVTTHHSSNPRLTLRQRLARFLGIHR